MTDDQVTVIMTKQTADARINTDHLLVTGTRNSPGKHSVSATAAMSAHDRFFECLLIAYTEREYEPREDGDGMAVARIPDGTTTWPWRSIHD